MMIRFLNSACLRLGLLAFVLGLAACSSVQPPRKEGQPSFYTRLDRAGADVDAAMAAEMISGFRHNHGRGALMLDPALMAIARAKAETMARADNVAAGAGNLDSLLLQAGRPATGTENTSAGYLTLAEAFSGWRDSPPHRATMLMPEARHMGIATAYRPGSKYRVYWALVLSP